MEFFVMLAVVFIFLIILDKRVRRRGENLANYSNNMTNSINDGNAFSPMMYNKPLKELSDDVISKTFEEQGFGKLDSTPRIESKKTIFAVIFSLLVFTSLMIFMFRINFIASLVMLIGSITLFLIFFFKIDIYSDIYKEFNSRPDENMDYIISSYIQNKVNVLPFVISRVLIIALAFVIPFIIFSTPKMFYEHSEDGYIVRFYAGYNFPDEIVIPDTYKGEPVVGIRGNVFKDIKTVKKIVLSKNMKEINGHAFENNKQLQEIVFPESLEYIGASAFRGCNFATIELPQSIKAIEPYAFAENESLTKVIFNNDTIDVGAHAFRYDNQLTDIGNVKLRYIGAYAFASTGITNVNFSDETAEIHEGAFQDSQISLIELPKGLIKVGKSAFENTPLVKVYFNDDLKEIGEAAFKNTKLESVSIPDTVYHLGAHSFRDCSKLTSVKLPSSITEIKTSTFRDTSIASIEIPDGVNKIGENAFRDCLQLKSVTVPRSVRIIDSKAFRGCASLKSITIPRGTSIGSKAFDGAPTNIRYYD